MRLLRLLIIAALGMAVAVSVAVALGLRYYRSPGPLANAFVVVVPHGGVDATASTLAEAGVIGNRLAFKCAVIATASQRSLRAAEFAFPAHASLAEVVEILRFARPVQHRLTIPEGLSAAQIAILLADADGLSGDVVVPAEGTVLPDTYHYERGSTRQALLDRAQEAMASVLAANWAARAPGLALGSARDALVMASIVEREAKLPAERGMIARVFLNRITHGMRLQADPTVVYGASGGYGALDRA